MGSLQWGWVQGEQRWHKALALRHRHKQALRQLKGKGTPDPRTRTLPSRDPPELHSQAGHQPVLFRWAWEPDPFLSPRRCKWRVVSQSQGES